MTSVLHAYHRLIFIYVFQDGNDFCVKEVGKGDSIHSLLSILDVLTVSAFSHWHVNNSRHMNCTFSISMVLVALSKCAQNKSKYPSCILFFSLTLDRFLAKYILGKEGLKNHSNSRNEVSSLKSQILITVTVFHFI